jgi:hypothetical protein
MTPFQNCQIHHFDKVSAVRSTKEMKFLWMTFNGEITPSPLKLVVELGRIFHKSDFLDCCISKNRASKPGQCSCEYSCIRSFTKFNYFVFVFTWLLWRKIISQKLR